MKRKLITFLLACILTAVSVPTAVFADADKTEDTKLIEVTLNEVAHSIFYAPQYVAIENGYFEEEGLELELVTGFGVT